MSRFLRLVTFAGAVAAVIALSPNVSAVSPEAAYVQLQLGKLLFSDGRYMEAFAAFEQEDRWFTDASSIGLVGAGLRAVARWLGRS